MAQGALPAKTESSTKSSHDAGDEMTLLTRKIRNLPRVYDGSNPQFVQFFQDLQLGDDFFREKTPEELNTHVQTIVAELLTGKLGLNGDKAIQAAIHPSTLTEEMKVRITHARLSRYEPTLQSRYFELDHSHVEEIVRRISPEILIKTIIHKINASSRLEASAEPIDPHTIKALRKALFKYRFNKFDNDGIFFGVLMALVALYEYSVLNIFWISPTHTESRLVE